MEGDLKPRSFRLGVSLTRLIHILSQFYVNYFSFFLLIYIFFYCVKPLV